MNITSKSRYGLKILLDLAAHSHLPKVARRDIVTREGIPAEYLDQIMMRLRARGLVESLRGRHGGYRLGREAANISVLEVFSACEDMVMPTLCAKTSHEKPKGVLFSGQLPNAGDRVGELGCEFEADCIASDPWKKIFSSFANSMSGLSIADLLDPSWQPALMSRKRTVQECKAGERASERAQRLPRPVSTEQTQEGLATHGHL
jgi:Rrf2 family protein